MAAAEFSTLLPEVLTRALACPDLVAMNAIRNAVIELLSEAFVYVEDLDPVTVVANEAIYDIAAPLNYDVVQVLKPLYFNDDKLAEFGQLDATFSRTDWRADTGPPRAWTSFHQAQITLYPVPTTSYANALTGRVALCPTVTATGVEARILTQYRTLLAAGALAQILMMPGQPFTNPKLAVKYEGIWKAGVANTRILMESGLIGATQRVRFNRSF